MPTITDALEEKAKKLLKTLKKIQEEPKTELIMSCPRCGKEEMDSDPILNALSRHEDVYICSRCGTDEGLRDTCKVPPMPLLDWAIFKALKSGNLTLKHRQPERRIIT